MVFQSLHKFQEIVHYLHFYRVRHPYQVSQIILLLYKVN